MENLEANEKKRLEDEAKEREQRAKVEAERQRHWSPIKISSLNWLKQLERLVCRRLNPKKQKQACARISDRIVDLHLFIIEQSENL